VRRAPSAWARRSPTSRPTLPASWPAADKVVRARSAAAPTSRSSPTRPHEGGLGLVSEVPGLEVGGQGPLEGDSLAGIDLVAGPLAGPEALEAGLDALGLDLVGLPDHPALEDPHLLGEVAAPGEELLSGAEEIAAGDVGEALVVGHGLLEGLEAGRGAGREARRAARRLSGGLDGGGLVGQALPGEALGEGGRPCR
jgi:hypothetical protein